MGKDPWELGGCVCSRGPQGTVGEPEWGKGEAQDPGRVGGIRGADERQRRLWGPRAEVGGAGRSTGPDWTRPGTFV